MSVKPVLFFGYGNPSRGDDAIGPLIIDALLMQNRFTRVQERFDALTDFQCQIEHTLDIHQRMHIVFIDAQIDLKQPFLYRKISALQDNTYTTHSMSPQALLQVYRQIYNMDEPDSYLLTIDAHEFKLGTSVSQRSKYGMEQALDFIQHKVLV